ncbi:UMF1 family MFS transporter [Agromyces sp. 3263]|uniref:MFS transporter n=1 Tax=Agromyces sp. 3263 TaxID=2817750 RepID=UPI002867130F|nr:UMF1 family MFS transporter [Agromyces sp. 3263]
MTLPPEPPAGTTPVDPGTPVPPATADSGAIRVMGLQLQEGRVIPRRQVVSWALWDWATQPFNSVILTFVFTALYLTSDTFLDPAVAALGEGDPAYERGLGELASALGWAITISGVLIAVLAPVLGQRADVAGRRKLWLGGATAALVACMVGLFFVQGAPAYFVLGISLIAAGTVFSEIAGVNYNAMLVQVSTPKTVGKVSGLGWGLGYVGGIVALVLVVVATTFDWWGMPTDNGLAYRVIALGCAVWTLLFAWPVLVYVPEAPPAPHRERVSFFRSYVVLVHDIVALWRGSRPTFWFLLASAVFRDGLAGVFAFGAVIAAVAFHFSSNEVLIFGIAANLLAGVSTIVAGRFDDRFGPRAVILTALGGLIAAGLLVFFLHDSGKLVFWVFGLVLTLFVGPAQAASRSFLARVTPAGRESEIFGLYATTGRAASFLSPMLWATFIAVFGATYWGILGIVIVIAAGFVLMLYVKVPAERA